jgi:hypothetical protein
MAFQPTFLPLWAVATLVALGVSKKTSLDTLQSFFTVYGIFLPAYLFYVSYIYPFYISELRHVPTVPGFPLWGQFYEIITQEVGVPQRKWHKEHGPIIRYFFPFGAERLAVADDEAIKQVRKPRESPQQKLQN